MANSKNSKLTHGLQRRLFEKRGYYRKVFRKICAELKVSNIVFDDLDMFLFKVNSGEIKLQNSQLEEEIKFLFKLANDIKILEQKLKDLETNSSGPREKELS